MGPLGADPEALHELSSTMRTASARLDGIATGLDRRTRVTGWHGPDAERFARDWHAQHGPALRVLGENCSRLAATLRAQAEQQTRASAGGAPVPARTGHRARSGPILTETTYTGGIEIKAAVFNGVIRGDVSIRELGGGRTRVTVSETALAGLVASAGARIEHSIGDEIGTVTPASGRRAEGKVRAGAVIRRSWEVGDDEVTGLLSRVAADELLTQRSPAQFENPLEERRVGGAPTAWIARGVGGIADEAIQFVTGVDPGLDDELESWVSIPAAERVETLLVLEAVGGAGAGAASTRVAPAGYIGGSGAMRGGVAAWDGGRSIVLEQSFEGSASASVGLLGRLGIGVPDNANAASDVRIELVQREDGAIDHVIAQVATTVGTERSEGRVELDLTGDFGREAAAGFRRLADRVSSHDLDGTVGALNSLAAIDVPFDEMEMSATTADVSGTTSRLGGTAGAGISVGISAHGQVERIRRTG